MHEKKVADYRGSIMMHRTGNCAGNNGPTAFIVKDKWGKAGFTTAFLEAEGAAPGSTMVMTKNVFMMDAAWEEIADDIA